MTTGGPNGGAASSWSGIRLERSPQGSRRSHPCAAQVLAGLETRVQWYKDDDGAITTTTIVDDGNTYEYKSVHATDMDGDGDLDVAACKWWSVRRVP